jgi:6-phosphogluconolactonase
MTYAAPPELTVFSDPENLARGAADWMLSSAQAAPGHFSVALSGGSTPRRLYELLASTPYREAFPWARAHWFWGDERFVPHDDPQSNYRMAWEAMFSHVPAPPENIHPAPTESIAPEAAAVAYEDTLRGFYGGRRLDDSRPLFDLTLLGLGADGHTASLFPGASTLGVRDRWVAAVRGVKAEDRLTLTYPALDSSRQVAFLVEGSEKNEILARLLAGDASLPAVGVRPRGKLLVLADRAAMDGAP